MCTTSISVRVYESSQPASKSNKVSNNWRNKQDTKDQILSLSLSFPVSLLLSVPVCLIMNNCRRQARRRPPFSRRHLLAPAAALRFPANSSTDTAAQLLVSMPPVRAEPDSQVGKSSSKNNSLIRLRVSQQEVLQTSLSSFHLIPYLNRSL